MPAAPGDARAASGQELPSTGNNTAVNSRSPLKSKSPPFSAVFISKPTVARNPIRTVEQSPLEDRFADPEWNTVFGADRHKMLTYMAVIRQRPICFVYPQARSRRTAGRQLPWRNNDIVHHWVLESLCRLRSQNYKEEDAAHDVIHGLHTVLASVAAGLGVSTTSSSW